MAITYDLSSYVRDVLEDNPIMKAFYLYYYGDINPNITGYVLVFMVPPDLSGIADSEGDPNKIGSFMNSLTMPGIEHYKYFTKYHETKKLLTYTALDFSPPQTQVQQAQITPRTGGVPYATDVTSSENCNITYVDNMNNTIYLYHLLWVEYIRAIAQGGYWNGDGFTPLAPVAHYYTDPDNPYYGTLDYASSIYMVKYMPDMKKVTYIGKALGAIPVSLPSRELMGNRTSNDLAILPFDYIIGGFREWVHTSMTNNWLNIELMRLINSNYE